MNGRVNATCWEIDERIIALQTLKLRRFDSPFVAIAVFAAASIS